MTTFDRVRDVVERTAHIAREEIHLESRLWDDLNIDSLGMMELMMGLEDEFGIAVDDSVASDLQTVGQIVELLERARSTGTKPQMTGTPVSPADRSGRARRPGEAVGASP